MSILTLTMWVLACVLVSAVLDRFVPKVSSPLIQVALGLAVAVFFKVDTNILTDEKLFMVLFIAPLLYNEAQNASKTTMARNRGAILSLAIGLVLITTFFVGFTLSALVVTIPLAAACALGAALGPTDAVAVTALPDDVKVGNRIENILKGECLLNDATGIVCFQFALTAMTAQISPAEVTITFVWLFIGGVVLGVLAGLIFSWALNKIKDLGLDDTTFHVLIDLLFPFFVYFVAEFFNFSGIIAVVAAGIVKSFKSNKIDPILSKTTIVSQSVWSVITFALNGAVFVLLGMHLPDVIIHIWLDDSINNTSLVLFTVCTTLAIILVRFAWTLSIEHRQNKATKWNDKAKLHSAALMTFGGPKGAVTMAIALSIPATLASGEAFPGRAILLFIAAGVILITLLLANIMLPILMPKRLKKKARKEAVKEQNLAAIIIEVLRSVIEQLTARQTPETRHATANVIAQYTKRIEDLKSDLNFDDKLNVEARNKALQLEREFVNDQLKAGSVSTHIAFKYLKNISMRQDLLTHRTSLSWSLRNAIMRAKAFMTHLPKKTKNIAQANNIEPGETAKLDTGAILRLNGQIDNIYKLRQATMHHVIDCLSKEVAAGSVAPTEDMTNIIEEYRQHLTSMRSKSPSLTAMSDLLDKEQEVISLGLHLEAETIQNMYMNKQITYDQMRRLTEQVRLMQVANEEFVD